MTGSNLVLCVRNVVSGGDGKAFGAEPGPGRFLDVPDGETPHPEKHRISRTAFRDEVLKRASTGTVERKTGPNRREAFTTGNVLVFVHGYNNRIEDIMERHNLLQAGLGGAGYRGAIVSFDWPSDDSTLNYLEDRRDAKTTAFRLVDDGIRLIAGLQKERRRRRCDIDVHLLGHSTGAYVIREAFSDAEQHASLSSGAWTVSQVAFIGADISAASMSGDSGRSRALFRHAARITNYSSRFDRALRISNVKRLGTAPRVGRVGLPADAHSKCVDVDCSTHWRGLPEPGEAFIGDFTHSWHFGDPLFARDLAYTIEGDIDRHRIPTRRMEDGGLALRSERAPPDPDAAQ